MKGKKVEIKARIKSTINVYSKILACFILVAMFSGYLMPLKVLADPIGNGTIIVKYKYANMSTNVEIEGLKAEKRTGKIGSKHTITPKDKTVNGTKYQYVGGEKTITKYFKSTTQTVWLPYEAKKTTPTTKNKSTKETGTVYVVYKDENNKEINKKTIKKNVGDSYNIKIENTYSKAGKTYEYDKKVDGYLSGKITSSAKTVIIYYKETTKIRFVINYINEKGEKLQDSKSVNVHYNKEEYINVPGTIVKNDIVYTVDTKTVRENNGKYQAKSWGLKNASTNVVYKVQAYRMKSDNLSLLTRMMYDLNMNNLDIKTTTDGNFYYFDIIKDQISNKKVSEFDFSNSNLKGIKRLPNFSVFKATLKTIKFSNCSLDSLETFENAYNQNGYFKGIPTKSIWLDGNTITKDGKKLDDYKLKKMINPKKYPTINGTESSTDKTNISYSDSSNKTDSTSTKKTDSTSTKTDTKKSKIEIKFDEFTVDDEKGKVIIKEAYEYTDDKKGDPLTSYVVNNKDGSETLKEKNANREFTIDEDGNYTVYLGIDGKDLNSSDYWTKKEISITTDKERPELSVNEELADTGIILNIQATDNGVGLKKIEVLDKDSNVIYSQEYTDYPTDKTERCTIDKAGKYTIKAIDKNDNETSTEFDAKLDKEPPKIVSGPTVEVKYNTRKTKVDGNNSAKIGDDIVITLTADEVIKSLGNSVQRDGNNGPFEIFNMEEPKDKIDIYNGQLLTFNSAKIELKFRITEEVLKKLKLKGKEGSVGLQLYGLRDEYNNEADSNKLKFENIFYLDDKAPKLTNATISAKDNKGSSYTDKNDQNYMIIASGNKYVIYMTFDEELNEAPQLRIGSYKIAAKEKDSKNKSSYTAEIDCDELLNNLETAGLVLNSDVPVIITNIIDKAENKAEDVTINKDNKSTNGYSFNYGMVETEDYFVVGTNVPENSEIGDINKDDIINNTDKELLNLAILKQITLKENEKTNYDLNKDGAVDSGDLLVLEKKLKRQINFIYMGQERGFKVISKENLENKNISTYEELNNKFNVELYDASGNKIESGDNIQIKIENNTIKITPNGENGVEYPITLKVVPKNNTSTDERKIGYITLEQNNGYNIGDDTYEVGYIFVKSDKDKGEGFRGDVNNDGYITPYDSILALRASVKLEDLSKIDKNAEKRADYDKDGKITAADSLGIMRIDQGIADQSSIYQSEEIVTKAKTNTACNTIATGKKVYLDMAFVNDVLQEYSKVKDNYANSSIIWKARYNNKTESIPENGDAANEILKSDEKGIYLEIPNDESINDNTVIAIEAVIDENGDNTPKIQHRGLIYWKVVKNIELKVPSEEITVKKDEKIDLDTIVNIDDADIDYVVKHENIDTNKVLEEIEKLKDENSDADIEDLKNKVLNGEIDVSTIQGIDPNAIINNAQKADINILSENLKTKLVASTPGEALLVVKSGDEEKNIKVNVIQSIVSIDVDKTEVTVKQGTEEELKVTVNPQDATEDVQVVSSDKNIATIGYDEATKSYKIKGINGGNATIDVYSPSNNEIKKTINVTVEKQDTPTITKIEVENKEDGKVYKEGDEIFIRVNFDGAVAGTAPNLKIKFGEHYANGKAEFVEGTNNNTTIRYKYTVVNGDNGVMQIEKLSGGLLTDSTNAVQAKTSKENDVLALLQEENPDKTFINDSIYETMEGVVVDTEREEVSIISAVSKDSNWLKNGDEIKVQIVSEEELQKAPTVYFNDIEAKVEGEGTNYFASLPVTDEFDDGFVEIKVESIFDKAGNLHEALTAGEYNIDEPIIIDNSAPIVESVQIQKDEGQSVKEGDSVDIVVTFGDSANVTKEYVSSTEVPTLNLKVGGKAAQGTLTSDYKVGEYVEQITYTYTVAKGETGEITIAGMSGKVTDVAGNIKDLSKEKITNAKEEPIKTVNQPVATTTIKSPKTGDNVVIYVGIVLLITGIAIFVVELIYRKNKGNGRNK